MDKGPHILPNGTHPAPQRWEAMPWLYLKEKTDKFLIG